jgi:hypothetical protein
MPFNGAKSTSRLNCPSQVSYQGTSTMNTGSSTNPASFTSDPPSYESLSFSHTPMTELPIEIPHDVQESPIYLEEGGFTKWKSHEGDFFAKAARGELETCDECPYPLYLPVLADNTFCPLWNDHMKYSDTACAILGGWGGNRSRVTLLPDIVNWLKHGKKNCKSNVRSMSNQLNPFLSLDEPKHLTEDLYQDWLRYDVLKSPLSVKRVKLETKADAERRVGKLSKTIPCSTSIPSVVHKVY